ncbi:MAG: helix-turn-helix domain-containing protein, partial [Flavobacteriaceae bacterium]
IIEAENGEEGINKALDAIPDIIISDIMMPVKDGIHLSYVLKNDERTSHIPIILLTAKSGEENELTGLKAGADSYMVKPFREEKLRVVMERLLATRESIREKLNKQVIFKPQEIELTSADSQLLTRIKQILDINLTDPQFNTNLFCEQVGLSRMHLHRKLKALTGLSTSEFLRTHRLKTAAKLLENGEANISEVGYAVGFNQPAYFSTAFKQHFGCSPSEFIKTKKVL